MVWSQFSIKILGVHSGSSVVDNSSWDKISHSFAKKSVFGTECNSLLDEKKKRIVNQILLSKLWYIGQIYTILKFIIKELRKAIAQLPIC